MATLEITAVAPLVSMLPVISTEQSTLVACGCDTVRFPLRVKFATGLGVNVAAEAELAAPAVARARTADRTAAHLITLNSPRVVVILYRYLHYYKLLAISRSTQGARVAVHDRPGRRTARDRRLGVRWSGVDGQIVQGFKSQADFAATDLEAKRIQ